MGLILWVGAFFVLAFMIEGIAGVFSDRNGRRLVLINVVMWSAILLGSYWSHHH